MKTAATLDITRELMAASERLRTYLATSAYRESLHPAHLKDAAGSYLEAGGKYLRPCLLLWCCRALGGDEEKALPAALAVEVFHTWTLVHDDIIDRDAVRRGRPTVHDDFRRRGQAELRLGDFSTHYGQGLAILAGDVQHGWAVWLLAQAGLSEAGSKAAGSCQRQISRGELALSLIQELEGEALTKLVEGEVLDMQLSHRPLAEVSEGEVLHMVARKTAALFSFAAHAGAMLGKGCYCPEDAQVNALADFGYHAGMAFQLQDDILGIIGKETELGKPVGSDLREGKRTIPLVFSWQQAPEHLRGRLEQIIGNAEATEAEIREASELLQNLGGIAQARELAARHLDQALKCLDTLPAGKERELLAGLARLMLDRSR